MDPPDRAYSGPKTGIAAVQDHFGLGVVAKRGRRLGLFPLICVMYLIVSGGAYGLEDAVRIAGGPLTLALCVLVPISLSLPTALMAAELTALMPVEGGFYFWVKEALGPFAGFVEAYLTLLYTAVDMAIYPVLFTTYLAFVIPLSLPAQIVVGIALVWLAGLMNILGIRPVGNASVVLTAVILAPFAMLVVCGLPRLIHWQLPPGPPLGANFLGALGGGLTVVIWNFSGWENLSVVAEEIDDAPRTYLRAIAITLPIVTLGYLLPLAVSLSGSDNTATWQLGWFAHEGRRIGGPALELALALGGAIGAFAIFEAAMLWVSRMPFVLAYEGYLSKWLTRLWQPRSTPGRSILVCCVVFTLLVPLGFVALVVLDVFFYMGALVLEMAALVRLRRLRPERNGLFVIGGGRLGLIATAVAPLVTWLATFGLAVSTGGGKTDFLVAAALLLSTWPAYALARWRYGGPAAPS